MSAERLIERVGDAESVRDVKLRLVDHAAEDLGASAVGLYLFGPELGPVEIYVRGLGDAFVLAYEELGRERDPVLEHVARTGEVTHERLVLTEPAWRSSLLYRSVSHPHRIEHYLCAPIHVRGQLVGTLNLGRPDGAGFAPADLLAAHRVVAAVAGRVERLGPDPDAPTPVQLALQRADRARVRLRHEELERTGRRLSPRIAAEFWRSTAEDGLPPLDTFRHGDRAFVLLALPGEPTRSATRALTERERQVVALAAAGLTNKAIAWELGTTASAVAGALARALGRLGLASRVELVQCAQQLGLVAPHQPTT